METGNQRACSPPGREEAAGTNPSSFTCSLDAGAAVPLGHGGCRKPPHAPWDPRGQLAVTAEAAGNRAPTSHDLPKINIPPDRHGRRAAIQDTPRQSEIQRHPKSHQHLVLRDAVTSVWLWGDRRKPLPASPGTGSKARRAECFPLATAPHPLHLPPPRPSPPRCRSSPTPPSPRPRLQEGRQLLRFERRCLFSSSSWRSFLSPGEEANDGEKERPEGWGADSTVLLKGPRGMLTPSRSHRVNPPKISPQDRTHLPKAWQHGPTWPKTDCPTMASPGPCGAPAPGSSTPPREGWH